MRRCWRRYSWSWSIFIVALLTSNRLYFNSFLVWKWLKGFRCVIVHIRLFFIFLQIIWLTCLIFSLLNWWHKLFNNLNVRSFLRKCILRQRNMIWKSLLIICYWFISFPISLCLNQVFISLTFYQNEIIIILNFRFLIFLFLLTCSLSVFLFFLSINDCPF